MYTSSYLVNRVLSSSSILRSRRAHASIKTRQAGSDESQAPSILTCPRGSTPPIRQEALTRLRAGDDPQERSARAELQHTPKGRILVYLSEEGIRLWDGRISKSMTHLLRRPNA